MKKVLSVILACLIFMSCSVCVFAAQYGDADELQQLRARFTDGVGPEVNGFALDYALFTPGSAHVSCTIARYLEQVFPFQKQKAKGLKRHV